jgi:hypothetical protein
MLFWHRDEATEGQIGFLERVGIDASQLNKGACAHIMDFLHARRIAGLATVKQARLLARMGHPKPATASFAEAQEFITKELEKGGNAR